MHSIDVDFNIQKHPNTNNEIATQSYSHNLIGIKIRISATCKVNGTYTNNWIKFPLFFKENLKKISHYGANKRIWKSILAILLGAQSSLLAF